MQSLKQQSSLILGIVICLALAGYYGYLIFTNLSQAGKNTAGTVTSAVPALDEKSLLDIRAKSLNGSLPLTVQASDLGNGQLFSE